MKLNSLLKRSINLVKTGKAVMNLRAADGVEEKERAKHYLMTLLGNGRGLPAKVGQFMAMGDEGPELRNTLNNSIPAMPFEEVRKLLEKALGQPWKAVFKSIDKQGISASLGQVHFGQLIDKREVAIKIQYPEIAEAVESEMDLLGWMPKVGPVAKWGFDMAGYRDVFWKSFNQELNYCHEVENQRRYHSLAAALQDVVIPQVIPEYCRENILVQERVEGISIDEAKELPPRQRQEIGRTLIRHYVHMIFRHGFVHSDPHPGNFALRKSARGAFSLVIYDYGSILEI
ncbi:MAG: ABC1 kinase family protein, partial [Nitrospinales bacterium]